MIKKLFTLIAIACLISACAPAQVPQEEAPKEEEPQNQDPPKPEDPPVDPSTLKALVATAPVPDNQFIFDAKPSFVLQINNRNEVPVSENLTVKVLTDKQELITTLDLGEFTVPALTTIDKEITLDYDFSPGFYKAQCVIQKRIARAVNFGIRPTEIVSAPDMQADFDTFWADAYAQLKAVDMNPTFTQTKYDGTWMVSLNSIPDGLEGEPMVIRCYYVEPTQDGKAHPVIVHYYGYDDWSPGQLECPHGRGEFAHLYVSTRGQRINCRKASLRQDGIEEDFVNPYTKQWFTVNFGDKDSYYYRGAYMDCVQGIRFLALCEDAKVKGKVDMSNLFVEGMSQGGAFSYAAAALSVEYPVKALSAAVAFMGDFPDYFTIVPNEGGGFPGMAQNCKKALGWSDTQMYEFLSYFDTKNLATKVSCPILACSGLEDNICPPHTNIAPFNNAQTSASKKEYIFYASMGHSYPSGWDGKVKTFFKSYIK